MPFGTTKEVVPKGMISGTPTTLQGLQPICLYSKHVYLVPLAANLSARRENAIGPYAFSRRQGFGKSSLARRSFCVQAYCPQSKALRCGL